MCGNSAITKNLRKEGIPTQYLVEVSIKYAMSVPAETPEEAIAKVIAGDDTDVFSDDPADFSAVEEP